MAFFIHEYLGGESNPYLKFRKLLFYPLNYQGKPVGTSYAGCWDITGHSTRKQRYTFFSKWQ